MRLVDGEELELQHKKYSMCRQRIAIYLVSWYDLLKLAILGHF